MSKTTLNYAPMVIKRKILSCSRARSMDGVCSSGERGGALRGARARRGEEGAPPGAAELEGPQAVPAATRCVSR